jgi:ATP-dependent Lon protease
MTGEITLSGNVLPVGGIKEKVLAAKRAGVTDVILPAENKMNVEEDLTKEQLDNLKVHYVKTIDEALLVSIPEVAASTAAKMLTPTPEVHEKAFAQA